MTPASHKLSHIFIFSFFRRFCGKRSVKTPLIWWHKAAQSENRFLWKLHWFYIKQFKLVNVCSGKKAVKNAITIFDLYEHLLSTILEVSPKHFTVAKLSLFSASVIDICFEYPLKWIPSGLIIMWPVLCETAAVSAQVLCSPHHTTSLQYHFIQSCVHKFCVHHIIQPVCSITLFRAAYVLCSPHHTTSLQYHFIQSCVRRMHWCAAVTCRPNFWQNGWNLLHVTAVTQVWNRYCNKSWHRKLTLEKKILLPGLEP